MTNLKEENVSHTLTLNNYEGDESFRKILTEKIDNLLDVSPSDAAASSRITKTKTGYHGTLQIFSSQGRFIAETAAHTADDVIKDLFKRMHRQMKNWRNCRFW
jgi:hypothetical protein